MPTRDEMIQDNQKERRRLEDLARGLNENVLNVVLSNGWTVGSALVHMAFWDLRQETLITRWLKEGVRPSPLDWEAINGPLDAVGKAVPAKGAARLVTEAAVAADRAIEGLTPAQFKELVRLGFGRNLHRAAHRRTHLSQIEKALHGAH